MSEQRCRLDDSELIPIWDLGEPSVSDFVKDPKEINPFPLRLAIGRTSGLIQLQDTYSPEKMYRNYYYRSGTNPMMRRALQDIVQSAQRYVRLDPGDVVIDIGANDGELISNWDKNLVRGGFEPSVNHLSDLDEQATWVCPNFFSAENYYYHEEKPAKVITSIAMFYDLQNPKKFAEDIERVLAEDGLWICQMSYLPLMLSTYAWDSVCHEHLTYYSLETFSKILNVIGGDLYVVDAELNDVNGGSIRFYVMRGKGMDRLPIHVKELGDMRQHMLDCWEDQLGLDSLRVLEHFKQDCLAEGRRLVGFLERCRDEKRQCVGYGASTKGNTILQTLGITPELLSCIADRSPQKVGRYCIGSGIPIISEEEMRKMKPSFLLAFPWHFINEFLQREKDLLRDGTQFVVPLPEFKVVG